MRTETEGQSSHTGTRALHVQRSTAIFHADESDASTISIASLSILKSSLRTSHMKHLVVWTRRSRDVTYLHTSVTFNLEGSHWLLVQTEEEKKKNKQGNRADHWNSLAPFASRVSADGIVGVAWVYGALVLSVQENTSSLFSPQSYNLKKMIATVTWQQDSTRVHHRGQWKSSFQCDSYCTCDRQDRSNRTTLRSQVRWQIQRDM